MHQLTNIAWAWVSILMTIQMGILILSPNDGQSVIKSYFSAWAKTLRCLKRCFVPGETRDERANSIGAWGLAVLCVPGAVLVASAVSRMVG